MADTAAMLLKLLSLLQTRRDWTGPELAERLEVGARELAERFGRAAAA